MTTNIFKPRVMIVEDYDDIRDQITMLFAQQQVVDAMIVENARAALAAAYDALAARAPYNGFLIDVSMPIVNGLQLARALIALHDPEPIRIVYLTSHGTEVVTRDVLARTGAETHWQKSMVFPSLPERIVEWLAAPPPSPCT